jgi:hypothetical protein
MSESKRLKSYDRNINLTGSDPGRNWIHRRIFSSQKLLQIFINLEIMKKETKRLVIGILIIQLLITLMLLLSGCSHVYSHGKQFKPDRDQVTRCHTYNDVSR